MKFPAIVKKQNERMIAYPRNTEEVSNIVKFSNKNGLNIIPLGGETNRVDGTKPDQKSKNLFISFSKMKKIIEILKQYITPETQTSIIKNLIT